MTTLNFALILKVKLLIIRAYFKGEIICDKHTFITRKWDADEDIDRQHWSRFSCFQENKLLMNNFSIF